MWKTCLFGRFSTKDGDDIFDGDNKELVVGFEVDGDGVLGVKENLVVLPQRYIFVVFDLSRNSDDSARNRGNLGLIGKCDPALGLSFWFILANQDSSPDGFDVFESLLSCFGHRFKSNHWPQPGQGRALTLVDRVERYNDDS